MNNLTGIPRRRVVIEITLGADSRERAFEELSEILRGLKNGSLWGDCLTGGHSAGYVLKATEDETITHESYFASLEAMPK